MICLQHSVFNLRGPLTDILILGFCWHHVENGSAVAVGWSADRTEPTTECSTRCLRNQAEVRGCGNQGHFLYWLSLFNCQLIHVIMLYVISVEILLHLIIGPTLCPHSVSPNIKRSQVSKEIIINIRKSIVNSEMPKRSLFYPWCGVLQYI